MIEEILQEKIGLNINSLGQKKIDADVMLRMKKCEIHTLEEYLLLLQNSPEELERLIEIVTVPETWFFRMRSSFEYLETYLRSAWLWNRRPKIFRVLSIPCSTGEEPYSIAMTFLENGYTPGSFQIDAADISQVVLDKAQAGLYTGNSFRGEKKELVEKYFRHHGHCYELDSRVISCVHFFRQNILHYTPPPDDRRYDIIFCRNMLIYLDHASQMRAIELFTRSLKEDGLLFLGPAESGVTFHTHFISVKHGGSFAFQKTVLLNSIPPRHHKHPAGETSVPEPRVPVPQPPPPPVQPGVSAAPVKPPPPPVPPTPTARPAAVPASPLVQAQKLADAGELAAAEKLCRDYLALHKLDAQAYFLLGMILLASHQYMQAEKIFSQTLYLNPDHRDALLSLAAIRERQGDRQGATAYRERSKRIKQEPES